MHNRNTDVVVLRWLLRPNVKQAQSDEIEKNDEHQKIDFSKSNFNDIQHFFPLPNELFFEKNAF
jgi:hypothetical protein